MARSGNNHSQAVIDPTTTPIWERPEMQEFLGNAPDDMNRELASTWLDPRRARPITGWQIEGFVPAITYIKREYHP